MSSSPLPLCPISSPFSPALPPEYAKLTEGGDAGYANDKELGQTSFKSLETEFGFPTFVVHRGDLHKALLDRALELGVVLKVKVRFWRRESGGSWC